MLKNKQVIEPMLFEGYLVIALHPDWVKLFNKLPTMIAFVKNNKLKCEILFDGRFAKIEM